MLIELHAFRRYLLRNSSKIRSSPLARAHKFAHIASCREQAKKRELTVSLATHWQASDSLQRMRPASTGLSLYDVTVFAAAAAAAAALEQFLVSRSRVALRLSQL